MWLGALILAALVAGCVALLVIAAQVGDAPAAGPGDAPTILKMPAERS